MDFSKAIEDNLHDHLFISDYDKESFKGIELCLGIDEAGRGPVLGPMVYGALFCPADKEKQLKEMKCADSKSLSEKDRENIFEKINQENKFCGFAVKSLSPNTISTGMLGRVKYNLNELSHDTAMSLIDTLYNQEGLNITHVYLDTVGDPGKYELKISKRFPKLKIKVSKKADSIYPCVSAASICAKVTRDTLLKNWVFRENCSTKEYGSGYPGDPMTKKFLDANLNNVFGFVKLVRFSWSTAGLKLKKSCVAIKWPDAFEDNEDGDDEIVDVTEENDQAPKKETKRQSKTSSKSKLALAVASDRNNKSLLNFFQKPQKRSLATANSGCDVMSSFFTSRKLKQCKSF